MVNNSVPQNQINIPQQQSPASTMHEQINDITDSEESKTQELTTISDYNVRLTFTQEEYKSQYQPISQSDIFQYYNVDEIRDFTEQNDLCRLPTESEFSYDIGCIEREYHQRWMDIAFKLEKQLRTILMNRVENPTTEIPVYFNKLLLPVMNAIMNLFVNYEQFLRAVVYFNEILLMAQRIALTYLDRYPISCLSILKKLFVGYMDKFYDSRFYERQFYPKIQFFYAERQYKGLTSELQGYPRLNFQQQLVQQGQQQFNSHIFYPLQNEILNENKLIQGALTLSPLQRIQIHQFYQNNGFDILIKFISQETNLSNITTAIEILSSFKQFLNNQIYVGEIMKTNDILLKLPERISEEELRLASKENFQNLVNTMRILIQPLYRERDLNKRIGLIELRLTLMCFRSGNLEKRILGLQQFNERINDAQTNQYLANDQKKNNQGIQGISNQEWITPQNILEFIVENQVFEDIFGEKAHIELIRRSVPLVRFLYQQKHLGDRGVIHLMKLVRGKHEAWASQIYRILNELAEVLLPDDIVVVLQELEKNEIENDMSGTLNFMKSFGRNQIFEQAEKQVLQQVKRMNQNSNNNNNNNQQQIQQQNVLDDMDMESKEQEPRTKRSTYDDIESGMQEENIKDLQENHPLMIKVHSSGQEQEQTYEFNRQTSPQKKQKPHVRIPGTRHYVQNHPQRQQQQQPEQNSEDETQYTGDAFEDIGIRISGRILQRLYEWLVTQKQQQKSYQVEQQQQKQPSQEQCNQISQVFLDLLCRNFKYHRFIYLVRSFNALQSDWDTSPQIHIQIILRIMQSEYPILNTSERILITKVSELSRQIEHQYNIKISAVGWISRLKKNCVETLFQVNNQDSNKIIQIYLQELEIFLQFYSTFYQLCDGHPRIEQAQLRLLWQVIVENALNTMEQNAFFGWLHSSMLVHQKFHKICVLSPESIQLAFFEYLVKIDHTSYTPAMFTCLHDFILHYNIQYKLLKSNDNNETFIIMSHELIGSEVVWHLFFESLDPIINQKAEELLLDLIRMRHNTEEVQNQLKAQYTQRIMNNVHNKVQKKNIYTFFNNLKVIQDPQSVKRSLNLLVKLLEELEGLRGKQNSGERGEKITITLDNKIKGALPPKKQEVVLWTNMTILQVKQQVAQKLNPSMKPEEFDLVNRGNWLSDNKTLREYRFENKLTMMVCSRNITDEQQQQQGPVLALGPPTQDQAMMGMMAYAGQTHNDEMNAMQVKLEPSEVEERIQQIREITGEDNKEFVKYVLEQKNYNVQDVIEDLILETKKDQYQIDFQYKKPSIQIQKIAEVNNKNVCVSTLLSENQFYMNTFFEILQTGNSLQQTVWQILQLIPKNKSFYTAIKSRLYNNDCLEAWENIFDSSNSHKLLYNLQILREILECDLIDDPEELRQRREGRERFLINGGLACIIQLLMNFKNGELNENTQHRTKLVGLLLEIYSLYSNAYLLSQCDTYIKKNQLKRLINLPETLKDIYKNVDQSYTPYFLGININYNTLNNSQSASTPNFQSMGTTPQNIPTPPHEANSFQIQQQQQQKNDFYFLVQFFEKGGQYAFEESHHLKKDFANMDIVVHHCLLVIEDLMSIKCEESHHVLEQAVTLLLTLFYHDGSLISTLYTVNVNQVFLNILLSSQNEELRRIVAFTVMTVCEMVNDEEKFQLYQPLEQQQQKNQDQQFQKTQLLDPRTFFLKSYLPLILNEDERIYQCQSDDIFIVITNLLRNVNLDIVEQFLVPFDQLFKKIAEYIIKRPFIEQRFDEKEDKVLQGYLLLLTTIIEIQPQFKTLMMEDQFLQKIYDFLFYIPQIENVGSAQAKQELLRYPKCKHKLTRKRAFQLLIESCKNTEENFTALLDPIIQNHERYDHNDADSSGQVKGSHGYVGLKNLGCTCYINSLLQQMFMMRELRSAILNSDLCIPKKIREQSQTTLLNLLDTHFTENQGEYYNFEQRILDNTIQFKKLVQENTLYQLQLVFASLQESVKQFYNPQHFIQSIKYYDGQPINVLLQQDVNEFFNLLTDNLENKLKGTKNPDILQRCMGGKLGYAIVSLEEEYPFEKETEEPFLTVTIEIKNKKNLEEALDMFVKGDILEGENKYFCEQYERKLTAEKRCYFKKLPHTLVLTLKRFEFDYNQMSRVKVNDYFEFPQEISLQKYSKDPNCNYNLVGVLVHSGSAEGGHYYSFIKDRQGKEWFEFNDQFIKPFNSANIKIECFGGKNSKNDNDFYDWDNTNITRNAYLLFYERADENQIEIEQNLANEHVLVEQVWRENLIYLRNLLFYSADYLCFVQDFICQFKFPDQVDVTPMISYDEEMLNHGYNNSNDTETLLYYKKLPAMKVIKLMTMFSHETLIKTNDPQGFVNSMQTISTLIHKFIPSAFWFLGYITEKNQILIDLLIKSSYNEVKDSFAKLLTVCILHVFKTEEQYLMEEIMLYSSKHMISYKYEKSCLIRFLDVYIKEILPVAKKSFRKSAKYFQVIQYIVSLSPQIVDFIYKCKFYSNIYQILVDTLREYSLNYSVMSIQKLNEKGIDSATQVLFETIAKIVCGSVSQGMQNLNEDSPTYIFKPFQLGYPLIEHNFLKDQFMLYDQYKKYFAPMMQLTNSVIDVTIHVCWGDKDMSYRVIQQILELLLDYFIKSSQTDSLFHIINSLVRINDQYQQDRIQMIFNELKCSSSKGNSIIDAIQQQAYKDKDYAYNCMKWIAEIGYNCKAVSDYMYDHQKWFEDMLPLLRNYKNNNNFGFGPSLVLSNIIKTISQFESILKIEKLEWQPPQQIEEEEEKNINIQQRYDDEDQQLSQVIQEERNRYNAGTGIYNQADEVDDEYNSSKAVNVSDKEDEFPELSNDQ